MIPLFDNINTIFKTPSLTTEQLEHFRAVLVNKFVHINNNPLLNAETISSQLVLNESLTRVIKNSKQRYLCVDLHYLFNEVPFFIQLYVNFDENGDYSSYIVLDGEPTGLGVNRLLHLLPIHRGDFSIQLDIDTNPIYPAHDEENIYTAQFSNVFNFEEKKNIHSLTINYEIHNKSIVKKYFKYQKDYSYQYVRSCDFDIRHEEYFIDFINLLFSGESELINSYINTHFFRHYKKDDRYIVLSLTTVLMNQHNIHSIMDSTVSLALKGAGDLFISMMDSSLKNKLIDELKLYDMATY